MKHKLLFILAFVIPFYFFINNVKADYSATVINEINASCSLKSTATGYCFYKDKNINSIAKPIYWLDTGDIVTVLTDYPKVESKDNICKDYYVYTSYYSAYYKNSYKGYYCNANLTSDDITQEEKEKLTKLGFPESYFKKLAILMRAHPNWNFKAINTDLDFNKAVLNQTYGSKSLLRESMSNNYAYLDYSESSFDYYHDKYYAFDDTTSSNPWYKANYDTIAYYMDPRNFLNDMYLFQFETLNYDENVSDDKLKASIESIFNTGYLSKFTDTFLEAGKISKVNPIYLASLSLHEVGNGSSPSTAIAGTYNGMYNFYNIGANSGANPAHNGLEYAAKVDEATLRPWNSEYKAIVGGAHFIFNSYIYPGQDTSYFKKFNVVYNYLISINRTPTYENYTHQYMQSIIAPTTEANTTYKSYYSNKLLDLSYTFYIPVYKNMPESTSLKDKGGWPNNYLSSISLNGVNIVDFDGGITEYNYNLDINNPVILIDAKSVSSKAKIDGLGKFEIDKDTTKKIIVTAENGNEKVYNINIKLTGIKIDDPIDVKTTLNNAGIKNNDKYISGINVSSNISSIKEKIINANKNAKVVLQNKNGEVKENGIVCTGDRVVITVLDEVKTYEVVIYGDVNGDGMIKATDYVLVKNKIMGTITLSGAYLEAADVDRNGFVKATDYVKIKNKIMGISEIPQ